MTVRDLIALLSTVEDLDSLVVLSRDSVGRFTILEDASFGSWSKGDFIETEDPVGIPAVCLWPNS